MRLVERSCWSKCLRNPVVHRRGQPLSLSEILLQILRSEICTRVAIIDIDRDTRGLGLLREDRRGR